MSQPGFWMGNASDGHRRTARASPVQLVRVSFFKATQNGSCQSHNTRKSLNLCGFSYVLSDGIITQCFSQNYNLSFNLVVTVHQMDYLRRLVWSVNSRFSHRSLIGRPGRLASAAPFAPPLPTGLTVTSRSNISLLSNRYLACRATVPKSNTQNILTSCGAMLGDGIIK